MYHENQIKAIEHINGPAMILAGPGSGKTTVIVERVKNLIKHQIPPEKILVVTFTKAAAQNMQRRFCNALKDNSNNSFVTFGTFHSVFYQMLKSECSYGMDSILAETEKLDFIKQCIIKLKIDTASLTEFIGHIANEIGIVKANQIPIEEYRAKCCSNEDFCVIFNEYEKTLKNEGKIDFDDILSKTYEMLQKNHNILKKWQQAYEYILIDEFQDINYLQYKIIKLLASQKRNLFVVGDDDQSIYGFRGSRPDIMMDFEKDYKDCRKIILNVNYRSCDEIVQCANSLICHNKIRFSKNIQANKFGKKAVIIRKFKNQGEEISYIVRKIKEHLRQGENLEDIAILLRNNSQIQMLKTVLFHHKIKIRGIHKSQNIYSGMVFKDIYAYLEAAMSFHKGYINENEKLIYILNKPNRYISREVILKEQMTFEKLKKEYEHDREVSKNIEQLEFHLKMIAKLSPYAAINYIKNGVGYEEYLQKYALAHHMSANVLTKQFNYILEDVYSYKSNKEWFQAIQKSQEISVNDTSGINLLTMHGAKGLEFKTVIIPDVNQGIIPSKKIIREKDFEEERRIFYVAMTRAIEKLYIFGVAEYLGNSMEMSMFVDEILGK